MKRFLLFLLFVSSFGFAQSNLVFNQVLTQFVEGGEIYTVPDGKVWKITAFKFNSGTTLQIGVGSGGENPGLNSSVDSDIPFWLKEGQTINCSNLSGRGPVSILEFNVVPVSADTGSSSAVTSIDDFNTEGAGIAYGDDYTPSESVTDYDGNVYETITIGPQTWTTSDLNVSTYRDGTPIPHITDWNQWRYAQTGAYTYVNQDDSGTYAKVYNLYAVMGKNDLDPGTPLKKLAPEGFHIPSRFEWEALVNFYGGDQYAANYLRSESGWRYDLNGNNQSGLNIVPGGWINDNVSEITSGFASGSGTDQYKYYGTSTTTNETANASIYINSFSTIISNEFKLGSNNNTAVYLRIVKN